MGFQENDNDSLEAEKSNDMLYDDFQRVDSYRILKWMIKSWKNKCKIRNQIF